MGWPWTCDSHALASWVAGITDLLWPPRPSWDSRFSYWCVVLGQLTPLYLGPPHSPNENKLHVPHGDGTTMINEVLILTLKIESPRKKNMAFGTPGIKARSYRMWKVPNNIHSQHCCGMSGCKGHTCGQIWVQASGRAAGRWAGVAGHGRLDSLFQLPLAYKRKGRVNGISGHCSLGPTS